MPPHLNIENIYCVCIGDITLAKVVIKTADGRIVLTATPVLGSGTRVPNGLLNCGCNRSFFGQVSIAQPASMTRLKMWVDIFNRINFPPGLGLGG
ncbi:MAG: hypothetical protein AAGF83_18485 [Cyanobacteria bacterium P01_G01_bin.67]